MHIPEQLFSLPLLKDLRTQQIELIVRRGATTVAASNLFTAALYTVPKDRVFCVSSFACQALPDAIGGTPVTLALTLDVDGVNTNYVCATPTTGFSLAAGQPIQALGMACSIWCPPGSIVGLALAFNTSATHSWTPGLTGLSFPRGAVAVS